MDAPFRQNALCHYTDICHICQANPTQFIFVIPCLDGIFGGDLLEYPGVIRMMHFKKEVVQALVMGIAIPAVLVTVVLWRGKPQEQPEGEPSTSTTATLPQPMQSIAVPVITGDQTVYMDLDEYLLGVLLAEMPVGFDEEAFKAQAVAARTFTLHSILVASNHEPAAICTEATCCQGYIAPLRYIQQGGTASHMERMRSVLKKTAGQVLYYDGNLILATYFSCSGGNTEEALAVWGQDYPYLKSVESPGEENAECFSDRKHFSPEEFSEALGIPLDGVPGSWFGVITYTAGGGVKTIDICGTTFQGTELRKKLGLRSTVFTLSASEEEIVVYTRGYGHRVGLSQYGAEAMALRGKDYQYILFHYYPGTTLGFYSAE